MYVKIHCKKRVLFRDTGHKHSTHRIAMMSCLRCSTSRYLEVYFTITTICIYFSTQILMKTWKLSKSLFVMHTMDTLILWGKNKQNALNYWFQHFNLTCAQNHLSACGRMSRTFVLRWCLEIGNLILIFIIQC